MRPVRSLSVPSISAHRAMATQASVHAHPNYVRIVEVGPRDGLQNEPKVVPTAIKLELINRLSRTGLRTIEATSFVSKKQIPQLADGDQVLTTLNRAGALDYSSQYIPQHISYPVLVPNERYFEAAVSCGAREIAIFGSASEGFSKRNINCSVAEALARFRPVAKRALEQGIRIRGYVSCVIACPVDGPTAPEKVLYVCQELLAMGCYEVSLGDTIGVGTPFSVRRLLGALLHHIPAAKLAGHFHDTYGQGCANVLVSLEMGLRVFDASVAGLGGCPFAKGATGNLATEDLVYMLQESGYNTGVDLLALAHIGDWISKELKREPSRAGNALIKRAKL